MRDTAPGLWGRGRGSGAWAKALGALALMVLAACGGADRGGRDGLPPGEETIVTPEGVTITRSARDQRAIERRERLRQEAAAANTADFTYFRYYIETSSDAPAACFVFSAALDPEKDYAPFVEFRPAFRPALKVQGRELCVGGLSFGDSRTAILKSGLPAADGRTLAETEEVPVDFENRPAFVGFKGAGVILPRSEADGLPVETVNVDSVRVTVSRVNDRVLFQKSIEGGSDGGGDDYYDYYYDYGPSDVAEEIWSGTMAVASQPNAPVVTVFPLGDVIASLKEADKPGAYYVRVEDGRKVGANDPSPASASRWVVVTDLALTVYRGSTGLDVTVRSLQTALAAGDVKLQLIAQNNEILAEVSTDANGRGQFDAALLKGAWVTRPKAVFAYAPNGDFAVLDLTRSPVDLSGQDVSGRYTGSRQDAYLYTDRGIYRPGESVRLVAMIRDREGRAIENRAGKIVVTRPNGMTASETRFTAATAGAVLQDIALPRDASRGVWSARAELDGVEGSIGAVSFAVEDFVPQRIRLDLTADEASPVLRDDGRDIGAEVRFLYGAPGAGLKVEGEARLQPDPSPFEEFKGFQFGTFDESFSEELITLDTQTTDGAGKATLRLDSGGRSVESGKPLRFNVVVSAVEPGGRAVSESVRVPYRPRSIYTGIRPGFEGSAQEGEAARFEVALVDPQGKGVQSEASWSLISIDYNYDWYRTDSGEWTWRRSRYVKTVNEGKLRTGRDGLARIESKALDWGDYQLIVTGANGISASYQFWSGWGGGTADNGVEAPDRVRVSGPSNAPRAGQSAEIAIQPPYDGEAQIVVATDRVVSVDYRPVTTAGARINLPVTEEWGEGAYVMVTVFSPRDPVLRSKPRRAVGVSYVPLDMSRRTFKVDVKAPDVARPVREQLVTVDISDGPREPVFLTLAAVDEGVLRLTKFASPDPVKHYFGRKSLQVDLYDDYGRLLDPNMGVPADVRSGGDQLGGEGLSVVPTRTVALWSGLVEVGRDGKAQVRLDLPEFNGELRLMAVAWSKTGIGAGERAMIVRDPAPVELTPPRFLAPGDRAFATASVDNVELGNGSFAAVVEGSGGLGVQAGNFTRTLNKGQRADERVSVLAGEAGIGGLNLRVKGPGNLDVSRSYPIQTRSAFMPVTQVESAQQANEEVYALPKDALAGFVKGSGEVVVSFSSLPMDAGALYASLARYPYGCTEQITSRALPLLYAEQLTAMDPAGVEPVPARTRVQEAIDTILSRQSPDGAIGLWREGDRASSPWLGAYAVDFLVQAKKQGYSVPNEAIERAYGALRNVGSGEAWRIYGFDTDVWESRYHRDTQERLLRRASAYALYVLAKAGEADVARLRYVHDRELRLQESPLARAQIAAALALMGDRARAASAFEAAEQAIGFSNDGDYYQTPLRDTAGVLALAAEAGFTDVVARLSDRISREAPDPELLSTQEKAFLLVALNALTGGQAVPDIRVQGLPAGNDNDRRYRLTPEQVAAGVSFTYRGTVPIWRTVMARGAPLSAPPAAANRLIAQKSIRGLRGETVDLSRVTQGDRMVVSVTLTPQEQRTNPVVLADLLPAGFEIETVLRPADGAGGRTEYDAYGDSYTVESGAFAFVGTIAQPRLAEARDDRFVAAIDLRGQPVTLAYVVRAVTPGSFTLPGAVAEDMYRPTVFARTAAGRVEVAPRS